MNQDDLTDLKIKEAAFEAVKTVKKTIATTVFLVRDAKKQNITKFSNVDNLSIMTAQLGNIIINILAETLDAAIENENERIFAFNSITDGLTKIIQTQFARIVSEESAKKGAL